MENIQEEDITEPLPSDGKKVETEKVETEQDPLKLELEKVEKGKRTKKEKLLYTRRRIDEQLKAEGVNPDEIEIDDDDAPLTRGEFKRIQAENATKTALQLADEIENETERELTKHHLQNTIRSTGNPKEDLRLAQAIVNQSKNSKIIEELNRKPEAKKHSSNGGETIPPPENEEFTPEEISFMKPPFNMSEKDILAAREGKAKFNKK